MKVSVISLIKPLLVGKKISFDKDGQNHTMTVKNLIILPGAYGDLIKVTFEEDEKITHLLQIGSQFELLDM